MIFKLAWRNIWRNKRRTAITVASIFFAVFFSVFMLSIQRGAWGRMLDNVVNFYYGYGQVHSKGYWEEQSIDNIFEWNEELKNLPSSIDKLEGVTPRLESFALASTGNKTSGMLIVGIDPKGENELTKLEERLIDGDYLLADEQATIIAEGAAKLLEATIGDTLFLISQGYHGVNAVGKYHIKGIVKFTSPDLNKRMVYLPLQEAQAFFGAEGLVSSVAMDIAEADDMPAVIAQVSNQLDTAAIYEVMNWQQMMPELVEAQKTDRAGNYLIMLILYLIIGFGIFGTILMMTKEREYEFGVLVSIGTKRLLLAASVWIETVFLGMIGALVGMVGVLPLVIWINRNPINMNLSEEMTATYEKWGFDPVFPTVVDFDIFLSQALFVVVVTGALGLFAVWKIYQIEPVSAMRR